METMDLHLLPRDFVAFSLSSSFCAPWTQRPSLCFLLLHSHITMQQRHVRRQDPISCLLCRRRKLRCNRQQPCSNCVARNVPCEREGQLPLPVTPQSGGSHASDTTIMARLSRLEDLVIRMSEQLSGTQRSIDAVPQTGTHISNSWMP